MARVWNPEVIHAPGILDPNSRSHGVRCTHLSFHRSFDRVSSVFPFAFSVYSTPLRWRICPGDYYCLLRSSAIPQAAPHEHEDRVVPKDSHGRTGSLLSDGSKLTQNTTHSHIHSLEYSNMADEETGDDYLSSIKAVAIWVSAAVIFGIGIGIKDGADKASEYFTGYLLEQSLSVDNLFVFVLIFKYFRVPVSYQNRVLSYGIAGAIFFRTSVILLGTATLEFEAVNLLLAAVLIYSSCKLFAADNEETDLSSNFIVNICQKFIPVSSEYDDDKFITTRSGVWQATPLLLAVAVIELSDIAFAIDSIPAIFGVTHDPFIVLSSNLFAIIGLRSLYTLIKGGLVELEYLQPAISIVLGFIGVKMVLDFLGYHVPTEASLGVVATSLTAGVLLSLGKSD